MRSRRMIMLIFSVFSSEVVVQKRCGYLNWEKCGVKDVTIRALQSLCQIHPYGLHLAVCTLEISIRIGAKVRSR